MDKCQNCELFVQIDEHQKQWYEKLSLKNIELHRKLSEQQDLIYILENKLAHKNIYHYNEHIHQCEQDLESNFEISQNEFLGEKLREMREYVEAAEQQSEIYRKNIERSMDELLEIQSYLNGQVEFYRESYFIQLEKTNQLKRHFLACFNEHVARSSDAMADSLKEEEEKISTAYRLRYRTTIKKSSEDLHKQSEAIKKLRSHNRSLYKVIRDNKAEYIEERIEKDKIIGNLRDAMTRLSKKNEKLQTQLKMEVHDCHAEIRQVHKQLGQLIQLKNNQQF